MSFAERIAFDEVCKERADCSAGGTPGGGPEGNKGGFVGSGKLEEGGEFGFRADAVGKCVGQSIGLYLKMIGGFERSGDDTYGL